MELFIGPILTMIAVVIGGICTFKGAAYGAKESAKEAQKLRDREAEVRRATLLQTLRRQIVFCQELLSTQPGEVPNLLIPQVSSLGPLLLDGQTLSYTEDAALLEKLLELEVLVQAGRFLGLLALFTPIMALTEDQTRNIELMKKEMAEGFAIGFKQVLDAIDASVHKRLDR